LIKTFSRKARRGIWKNGIKTIESPSEYKRRHGRSEEAADAGAKVEEQPAKVKTRKKPKHGLLTRLLGLK